MTAASTVPVEMPTDKNSVKCYDDNASGCAELTAWPFARLKFNVISYGILGNARILGGTVVGSSALKPGHQSHGVFSRSQIAGRV